MGTENGSGRGIKVEEGAATAPNLDLVGGGVQTCPHRTDAFFDDAETFASKEAFFEQARRKLLQDCGYETCPSKQKPTRISARCEKYATEGCPFRLSAFFDEEDAVWMLSTVNCTWQHSHDPISQFGVRISAPAATKPPRGDIGNASQQSRTAVLYAGGERFPSSDAFVQETRQLSLERYGVACWSTHRTLEVLQLGCANRKKGSCGYRVAARRDGRHFVVNLEGCKWVHSHPRESTNVVEPGTAQMKGAAPRQKRTAQDIGSEAENGNQYENGDDEEVDQEGAESAEDTAGASQIKIVPPTAPKVGDRFDTLGEAYVAFAVANILHFGKSVTRSGSCNLSAGMLYCYRRPSLGEYCPFRVVLGRNEDNTHPAVLESSTLAQLFYELCYAGSRFGQRDRVGIVDGNENRHRLVLPRRTGRCTRPARPVPGRRRYRLARIADHPRLSLCRYASRFVHLAAWPGYCAQFAVSFSSAPSFLVPALRHCKRFYCCCC